MPESAAQTIFVRIVRRGALPMEVRGQHHVWLVYLRYYGKNKSHLSLRAAGKPGANDIEFVDGRSARAEGLITGGFAVKLNSTKFKIMSALVQKGVAEFYQPMGVGHL